jgi:glucose/arabinose dehydrogenase
MHFVITISLSFILSKTYAALPEAIDSLGQKIKIKSVLKEADVIWGFDFLPSGEIIYTLRSGAMRLYHPKDNGTIMLSGVPKVRAKNQGGLLDVLVDPQFSKNQKIYFSLSAPVGGNKSTTQILSAKIFDGGLTDIKILFTAGADSSETVHYGSRLVMDKNRHLYFSVGDRGERKNAQRLEISPGKIFRVNADGSVPNDNPFINAKDAVKAIWSYGHRNPQGLALHPLTGELWSTEHGPRGGDELNLIKKGLNYGWPIITYGFEYWGPKIGETHKEGLEQPVYHYTPSIATSGLMIYSGKKFANWKGDFFIGSLKDHYISRVRITDGKPKEVEKLFTNWGERIRTIKESPSGAVYISTDSGQLIELTN